MDNLNPHLVNYEADLAIVNSKVDTPIWQINESLSSLFSLYYKQILFLELVSILNNNEEPQNIIIFDSEFNPRKISEETKNVVFSRDSMLSEEIVQLYELGLPYGMFPSTKINEINLLFAFFDSINFELEISTKLKHRKLKNAYNKLCSTNNLNSSFDYLFDTISNILKANSTKNRNVINKIDVILHDFKNKYSKIKSESNDFNKLNTLLENNNISKGDVRNDIYYKYYNMFFSKLYTKWMPLVAIYNPNTDTINFISTDVFKEFKNPYFFELKSISHNSPTLIAVAGLCVSILQLAYTIYKDHKANNAISKNQSGKQFSDIIDLSDLTPESKSEISEIINKFEKYNDLSSYFKLNIRSLFIKDELLRIHRELLSKCGNSLSSMGFSISENKKIKIYKR